jgi:glycolate oxidase
MDWSCLSNTLSSPVVVDADVLTAFTHDHAPLAAAGVPQALVRATSIDDVMATMRFAYEHGIAVVTRGAGTGLSGGANAIDACIILNVSAMNRIIEIDPERRIAIVEPGVINADLVAAAFEHGLTYLPDPSSRAISSIGGNIATNAGGACCLKYGVTGDHVAAQRVVLADGTLIATGSAVRKNVAGLDLNRLMIGSEGMLGVIVEATVRLHPIPESPSTLVAYFDDLEQAAQAVIEISRDGDVSLIELMDAPTIGAVDDLTHMGLDREAAVLILVRIDGPLRSQGIAACEKICLSFNARDVMTTDDVEEGDMLLIARHQALPALERLGSVLLDDVAVPVHELPTLITKIQAIAAEHQLTIGTFGHAGDGNLHPTIIFDQSDPLQVAAAQGAFDDIIRAAVGLGGTITGEHGIGSLKRDYLAEMVGTSEVALMQRIKLAFDPTNILNPHKCF